MTLNSGGLSFLNYKLLHNYKHRLDHRIAKVPSSANVFQASFEEFLPSNSNFEATCFLALCLSNIIAASNLQGKSVGARERLLPDLVLFTVAAFQQSSAFSRKQPGSKIALALNKSSCRASSKCSLCVFRFSLLLKF